jgi:hypothetical protein
MSALLENSVYCFKASIDNETCGFFKRAEGYHDMEHTQMCRTRLRCWNEVIHCVRYQCTLDWYLNRYIVDDEDGEVKTYTGKYEEYLILRILCRTAPSVTTFNKEGFISGLNKQLEKSKLITHIKQYYDLNSV